MFQFLSKQSANWLKNGDKTVMENAANDLTSVSIESLYIHNGFHKCLSLESNYMLISILTFMCRIYSKQLQFL